MRSCEPWALVGRLCLKVDTIKLSLWEHYYRSLLGGRSWEGDDRSAGKDDGRVAEEDGRSEEAPPVCHRP